MSQHTLASPEITYAHSPAEGTKHIWKTFWILSVVTVIELGIGLAIYNITEGEVPRETLILLFKGAVCILTLVKAFYIIAVFMHLGNELKNFVITMVSPMLLMLWFIVAFLWDGSAWKDLRNTNGHSREYKTEQVQKAAPTPMQKQ